MRGTPWTREEAEVLLESLVGPIRTIPFKYGWVAVPTKTEGDRAQGRHSLGPETYVFDKEAYVIDKDSRVITAHAAVAAPIIAKEYTRARRQGMIRGHRIWPAEA
ncbi:MAG: hypothetical protein ACR2J5_10525 [Geodermatophilaceae bacterium]|jgi:hypothetical protein